MVAERRGVPISAVSGEGIDELLSVIDGALRPGTQTVTLRIPHGDGAALALCYDRGHVFARSDDDGHVRVQVALPTRVVGSLATYRV